MNLLADENFPGVAVARLREAGHDVLWARTKMPGASDMEILRQAGLQSRLLLTFDKDFGELAFRAGVHIPAGVMLFRIEPQDPDAIARHALTVLTSRTDWGGHFAVVEADRVRVVALPSQP